MNPATEKDKTVMVVEDDEATRLAVAQVLTRAGYTVTQAGDGRQAINRLLTSTLPDLILLDLRMPVMNGWEFITLQKRDRGLAPIPVVVCSADGDIQQEAILIGAQDYLQKPIDPQQLLDTVRHCCSEAQAV